VHAQHSTQALDYTIDSNWVVLDHHFDSVTGHFVSNDTLPGVDVFFVYPTLIANKNDPRWNAEMNDMSWKNNVRSAATKYQASAFAGTGRTFVPFYRQAHLRSYNLLENGGREALLFAYQDVRAAFLHYMENYNNGRGIILAGHSQGSTQLLLLLKEFFDGKDLNKQLIAAYLPGIGIDKNEFEQLPLLTEAQQTGGFVTWNTFKWNYDIPQYNDWYKGKLVVNPITWNSESSNSLSEHKGFLYKNDKFYTQCIRTELIDGAIRMRAPKFSHRYVALFMDHYHIADINFFWKDIQLNSRERAFSYLNKGNH